MEQYGQVPSAGAYISSDTHTKHVNATIVYLSIHLLLY